MVRYIALPVSACVLLLATGPFALAGDGGYVAGDLRLSPEISVTQSYNDNIYTEDSNETGDYLTRIAPRLKAETIALPYELELYGGLEQVWFADETQNHHLNVQAGAKYRYRLDENTTWDAFASFRRQHEMPGDDEADPAADAGEPLPVHIIRAQASVRKEFDAFNMGFNLTPRLGVTNRTYMNVRRVDGTLTDQSDRSRSEYMAGGRVGVRTSPALEWMLDAEYAPRSYQREDAAGRDSRGGSFTAGFKYKPGADFMIEVAAGFMGRNFESAVYDDIATPDARVKAVWSPTSASKVTLNYKRGIREVTDTGTGGAVSDDARLILSHHFNDDFSTRIEGRYRHADYRGGNGADDGSDRRDHYYGLTLGLQYQLTDAAAVSADYTFGRNTSNDSTAEYTQNIFMLGLKAGM